MLEINLLILPGWGGSRESWRQFADAVRPDFKEVRVLDLPCQGNEPCPSAVWGVDEYADWVIARIKELNLSGQVALIGHSFGGQVALSAVSKMPALADWLVLSGAAVFRPKRILHRGFFGAAAKVGRIFMFLPGFKKDKERLKKIFYRAVGSPDYLATAGLKREIYRKIIRQDKSVLLPTIKKPTLIIWGEKDKYVPLKYAKLMHRLIPESDLRIIKNAGHGLHLNQIEEFKSALLDFLSHAKSD